LVAVVGGGLGVIEDGLVRDADIKDILQDISGLAGGDGEGHVEGQDKAEDILRVMNFSDVNEWFDRTGVKEFCGLE
jgi:hypothetical protein